MADGAGDNGVRESVAAARAAGLALDATALAPERHSSDGTAHWHHQTRMAFDYWRSVHPAIGLPGRQHIDPLDITELLPGLWLVEVHQRPLRLRYRLIGTAVVQAHGRENTGLWFEDAHPQLAQDSAYLERYRSVVAHGAPNWRRGAPRFCERRDIAEVENIILPLASDGQHVDMLMVHSVFYLRWGLDTTPS